MLRDYYNAKRLGRDIQFKRLEILERKLENYRLLYRMDLLVIQPNGSLWWFLW